MVTVILAGLLLLMVGCEQKTVDTMCRYGGKVWPSRLSADGVRECWMEDIPNDETKPDTTPPSHTFGPY